MPRLTNEIRERLQKYNMDPNEVLWDCHGTPVMYHKYIEQIAVIEGIQLDAPVIIRNDPGDVCILVSGTLGDHTEWSFGEASKSNNKNAYPFAMAEKRGKDRVILKLAGMSGHIYSDVDVVDGNSPKPFNQIAA
tara:strand:- start:188 stop:589 length:402 start_codon:yes stop_codon:yes gene_type:complete